MSLPNSGVITGAAISGLTSPTYTLVADTAFDTRSKQAYVSTLGGTQTGVVAHSALIPFTATIRRPSIIKTTIMAMYNGLSLQWSKVPFNTYDIIFRKGCNMNASGMAQYFVNVNKFSSKIFAGTETVDAANLKALNSLTAGYIWAQAQGIQDTQTTGVI